MNELLEVAAGVCVFVCMLARERERERKVIYLNGPFGVCILYMRVLIVD